MRSSARKMAYRLFISRLKVSSAAATLRGSRFDGQRRTPGRAELVAAGVEAAIAERGVGGPDGGHVRVASGDAVVPALGGGIGGSGERGGERGEDEGGQARDAWSGSFPGVGLVVIHPAPLPSGPGAGDGSDSRCSRPDDPAKGEFRARRIFSPGPGLTVDPAVAPSPPDLGAKKRVNPDPTRQRGRRPQTGCCHSECLADASAGGRPFRNRFYTNSCTVGLIVSSSTFARAGSVAASSTAAATSSGCNISARRSGPGGSGRLSRIGVSTSPG